VDHAVDVVVEADEQTEFGDVLDFAFDGRAHRVVFAKTSHGLRWVCFRPSDTRRLALSISRTMTSTSCEVETILPGWTFFLVQDISET
jgi:hypothetical protein